MLTFLKPIDLDAVIEDCEKRIRKGFRRKYSHETRAQYEHIKSLYQRDTGNFLEFAKAVRDKRRTITVETGGKNNEMDNGFNSRTSNVVRDRRMFTD